MINITRREEQDKDDLDITWSDRGLSSLKKLGTKAEFLLGNEKRV